MREIKYRIKGIDNKWHFLGLSTNLNTIPVGVVYASTVGEYTGLTDKNGKEIYEGDIVTGTWAFGKFSPSPVEFYKGSFGVRWKHFDVDDFYAFSTFCDTDWKVIGNIHDNPELLEEL